MLTGGRGASLSASRRKNRRPGGGFEAGEVSGSGWRRRRLDRAPGRRGSRAGEAAGGVWMPPGGPLGVPEEDGPGAGAGLGRGVVGSRPWTSARAAGGEAQGEDLVPSGDGSEPSQSARPLPIRSGSPRSGRLCQQNRLSTPASAGLGAEGGRSGRLRPPGRARHSPVVTGVTCPVPPGAADHLRCLTGRPAPTRRFQVILSLPARQPAAVFRVPHGPGALAGQRFGTIRPAVGDGQSRSSQPNERLHAEPSPLSSPCRPQPPTTQILV